MLPKRSPEKHRLILHPGKAREARQAYFRVFPLIFAYVLTISFDRRLPRASGLLFAGWGGSGWIWLDVHKPYHVQCHLFDGWNGSGWIWLDVYKPYHVQYHLFACWTGLLDLARGTPGPPGPFKCLSVF